MDKYTKDQINIATVEICYVVLRNDVKIMYNFFVFMIYPPKINMTIYVYQYYYLVYTITEWHEFPSFIPKIDALTIRESFAKLF